MLANYIFPIFLEASKKSEYQSNAKLVKIPQNQEAPAETICQSQEHLDTLLLIPQSRSGQQAC